MKTTGSNQIKILSRWKETRRRVNPIAWFGGLIGFAFGFVADAEPITMIGLGLVGYCFFSYVRALGDDLAIVQLMAFIAAVQWILGPYLEYTYGDGLGKYRMRIPEADYMYFALPAVSSMVLALNFAAPKISQLRIREQIRREVPIKEKVILLIILAGVLISFAAAYVPANLRFVIFLLAQVKFVGAIYLFIMGHRRRWLVLSAVFIISLATSAQLGLFHNIILWGALVFSFICFDLRLGIISKLSLISLAVVAMIGVQAAKPDYREAILQNPDAAGIELLVTSVANELFGSGTSMNDALAEDSSSFVRINQGWIISAVMAHVPASAPHENGKTVVSAFKNALLPRFLVSKEKSSVSDSFRSYTGLSVGRHTSFGISILGEAWVNFNQGGIAVLFAWGLLFGGMYRYISHRSITQPTFALWAPLIMLQAIKSETELVVALNHIVKAGGLVILIYYIAWRFFRIRI